MSKLLTALMNFRSRQAASFYESLEEKTFTIRMSPEMGRQVLGGLVALCAAAFLYFYFILKAHWQVSAYVVGHLTLFTLLSFMAITYLASGLRHGERFATLWKDASRPLTFTCYAWVSYLVMMVGLYYVLILDRTLPWKGEVVFPSGLAFLRFLYIGHSVVTLCLYWAALTVIFLSPYWVAVYYKWEYQRRYRGTARPEDFPFRLWIGKSTGALAKIAHGSGMPAKKQVCLSWQDATQNMVIFGGIGSGKTTRAIQPLLLQLMDKQCGGLIFDIKGNFQTAVEACAKATHSAKRLRIIGPHHEKLNLIEGLTPEVASSFLKSALMLANNKQNPFFIDTATELCRNALGVLSFLPQHYHLSGLYNYLFDNKKQKDMHEELEAVLSTIEHQTDKVRLLQTYQSYQEKIFSTYDDRIKSNILASVAQVLSPFNHPDLIDAFCSASTCKMEEVLNGTVFVVNLPLAVWGLGAKVASSFIKLRFFNVMQQREFQVDWDQKRLVFFMCDEFQEIVSANKDGLSDLNFWDKSRSSKTIGIISAQSVSSFYAAIGDRDCANALLQNFRQKICFRTEDQETLDFLNRLTGRVEVEKISYSEQSGSSGQLNTANNMHRSRGKTVSHVDKEVLNPQLIRNLGKDQAVALLVIDGESRDDVLDMEAVYM